MKNLIGLFLLATLTGVSVNAQDLKSSNVPGTIKSALLKKYPEAKIHHGKKKKAIMKRTGEESLVKIILYNLLLQENL